MAGIPNPDRGWNDPPKFQCESGLIASAPPKSRVQLTKRVAFPPSKKITEVKANVSHESLSSLASSPPRVHPFLKGGVPKVATNLDDPITTPIPVSDAPRSPAHAPETGSEDARRDSSREKRLLVVEAVESSIRALREKNALPEKQLNEVEKKMALMTEAWKDDEGNAGFVEEVENKLTRIAEEIVARNWEGALKLQVALAVDHPSAVNKWVMALKKILVESKKHFPQEVEQNSLKNDEDKEASGLNYFIPTLT